MADEEYGQLMDDPEDFMFLEEDDVQEDQAKNLEVELARTQGELHALKSLPKEEPRVVTPHVQQHVNLAPYKPSKEEQDNLFNSLASDPLGTLGTVARTAIETTQRDMNAKLIPIKAGLVNSQISLYKQVNSMPKAVEAEFNKLVKEWNKESKAALADDEDALNNALATLKTVAYGQVAQRGESISDTPQRTNLSRTAPSYGKSSAAGSSAGVNGPKTFHFQNDEEKRMAKVAREEWGFTDAQIKDLVMNGRKG